MKDLYFSHDRNALNDNKITDLRGMYGMEGYGVYWAVVEALSREPEFKLEYSSRKLSGLQATINPTFEMKRFIDDCIEIELFVTDGATFWSESLKRRIGKSTSVTKVRSEAAKNKWNKRKTSEKTALVDAEWKRVIDAYQTEIGVFPMGKTAHELLSFYEDIGADAMIVAIERTNLAQVDAPVHYLKTILNKFANEGIKTAAEAEAFCLNFDKKKQNRRKNDAAKSDNANITESDDEPVKWLV